MSIHYLAMEHLDKAKSFMSSGLDEDLIHAALEMRFCIEKIFYKLVPVYQPELPDTVLDGHTWQPGQIIDMLVEIDPYVESDRVVSIGQDSTKMAVIGRQSGVDRKLVAQYYHALGFYLHARTDGKPHDYVKLKRKLTKLLPRLEKFRSDSILDGFAERVGLKCSECGRRVAKRTEALSRDKELTCPNSQCKAIFEYLGSDEKGNATLKLVQWNMKCNACGADRYFGLHDLIAGSEYGQLVRCASCGAEGRMARQLIIEPLDSERGEPRKPGEKAETGSPDPPT